MNPEIPTWTFELGQAQNQATVESASMDWYRNSSPSTVGKAFMRLLYESDPPAEDVMAALWGFPGDPPPPAAPSVAGPQVVAIVRSVFVRLVLAFDPMGGEASWWRTRVAFDSKDHPVPLLEFVRREPELIRRVDGPGLWVAKLKERAAETLRLILPRLRSCIMCGRYFYRLRDQRICGERCAKRYFGRAPEMRDLDRPEGAVGRPRKNDRADIETLHNGWLVQEFSQADEADAMAHAQVLASPGEPPIAQTKRPARPEGRRQKARRRLSGPQARDQRIRRSLGREKRK